MPEALPSVLAEGFGSLLHPPIVPRPMNAELINAAIPIVSETLRRFDIAMGKAKTKKPDPARQPLPRPPRRRVGERKTTPPRPKYSRASSSGHTSALATSPAPSAPARAVAVHESSNAGLRARATGGANGGSPRCARRATTTLRSEMSATIAGLHRTGRPKRPSNKCAVEAGPTRAASPPASRRRPRGSSAGGYPRRSRWHGHARATSPRRPRRAARRWSPSSSASSWRAFAPASVL